MSFIKNIFNKLRGKASDESTEKPESTEKQEAATLTATINASNVDGDKAIDSDFLENLEEELIRSDLGVELALDFVESLREAKDLKQLKQKDVATKLKAYLLKAFEEDLSPDKFKLNVNDNGPSIYLVVGVNGVGKTTSIGKLAHRLTQTEGKKVLIAAGDTFRAAAEEQLKIWADRSNADYIQLEHGAKSSAVVYKAIEKVKNEKHDVLIIDTAGRLQNKKNLMEELGKIKEVIDKNAEGQLMETMLVLDATTGQNAMSQAKNFTEVCDLSSIILSKFDGSAKAGMVFSIAHQLKLPVKLVGVGEGLNDLKDFDPDDFVNKYL